MTETGPPGRKLDKILDARGHRCPTPTLRLQAALDGLDPGEEIVLVADDPLARIDVPHFLSAQGHMLISLVDTQGDLRFTVRKGPRSF